VLRRSRDVPTASNTTTSLLYYSYAPWQDATAVFSESTHPSPATLTLPLVHVDMMHAERE
jgi:hypothetical protein